MRQISEHLDIWINVYIWIQTITYMVEHIWYDKYWWPIQKCNKYKLNPMMCSNCEITTDFYFYSLAVSTTN